MESGEVVEKKFLRPIDNTSIVQQVIDRLTYAMIYKELRPGDKLPTEMELAASFGVGRNSIREAIKILVSFGVLDIRRPEGTFVASGFSDKMINPLLYGIILDQSDSIDSLKELREWVDFGILELAMEKAEPEDIFQLKEQLEELLEAIDGGDAENVFRADDDFHEAISTAAHNSLLAQIAKLVRTLTSEMRMNTIRNMLNIGKARELKQAHEDLFNIIERKNDESARKLLVEGYFYKYNILRK
ncbi:MAG: FadR family transcriptional regulator [Selenomonadaceae bacterium]|nr:FadR family transcriptional regulator [Selenomonadaceae bacterium]